MTPLTLHIQRWLAEPSVWGVSDCCMSVLDWVSHVRGGDLGADLRLTYDDFASAQQVTRFFTEPLGVCRAYMEERGGVGRTADPVRGDVACFKWASHQGRVLPIAGICLGRGHFACRSTPGDRPGIVSARPDVLIGAWSVGYGDGHA